MHFSSPESISPIRLNISAVWKRISLIQNVFFVSGNVFLLFRIYFSYAARHFCRLAMYFSFTGGDFR